MEWTLFPAAGDVAGSIEVPARSLALEIVTDYFLGLWRTDLDIEVVRLYSITRSGT